MRPAWRTTARAMACAALLLTAACNDGSKQTVFAPAQRTPVVSSNSQIQPSLAHAGDRAHGIATDVVSVVDLAETEGTPSVGGERALPCGLPLSSAGFEDPLDACWAAFSLATLLQQHAQAEAAVRIGCERYRREDYCQFLQERKGIAQ